MTFGLAVDAVRAAPIYVITQFLRLPPPLTPMASFDISFVDPSTGTYVVSDKTNATIDVFNSRTNAFLGAVPGFTVGGRFTGGPNGVLIVPGVGRGTAWAGDGNGNLVVADLNTFQITRRISLPGTTMRADELAYDPVHGIILIANDAETNALLTFVSTSSFAVLGQIKYDGTGGNPFAFGAPGGGGIEQPAFDPATNHFFQAVPATTANPGGEIDEIDPLTMKIVATIVTPSCGPSGLTLGPRPSGAYSLWQWRRDT